MNQKIIAFLGAGNLASSLIVGLINSEYPKTKIWATNKNAEKLQGLKQHLGITVTTDNCIAAEQADIVVLCVKPNHMHDLLKEIQEILSRKKILIISVAAGMTLKDLESQLGAHLPIVRAMPNTPAFVSCAATALVANTQTSEADKNTAESILRAVGLVVWLEDEKYMDLVTALSGSGPAYFFLFMESLQKAAVARGLSSEIANLLVIQTALGAARMALETNTELAELRRQVTSPGGTTEQAIRILEEGNIDGILAKALLAAEKRSEELSLIFSQDEKRS